MKQNEKLLRIFLAILLLLTVGVGVATAKKKGNGAIKFQETSFNFGNIKEDGGPVSHEFEFINEGPGNLVIYDANAPCGCTKPTFSEEAVQPGKTGRIKVTYNPLGRPGGFSKTVTVRCSGHPSKITLKITGTVIPKK